MFFSTPRQLVGLILLSVVLVPTVQAIDFAHEVVPILREHCAKCHADREAKGGFSINTRQSFLESDSAVPGDSAASHFLELIQSDDPDLQMPPKDRPRVGIEQRATLVKWIDEGMPWTEGFTFAANTYQPPLLPRPVTLPGDKRQNPIDRLLANYFAERNLDPPEPVDDATFVRRASLDLCGLLPPVESVNAFTSSHLPTKHTDLIDQLLADDLAYTEHWLTFWNDLLRNDYDGTGFITGGRKQISSWLYRSLINNKPFDQFTRELVAPESDESRGFIDGIKWRGTVSAGQTIEIQFAQNVAQSFLGINLKCASCHDSFIDRWKLSEAYSLAAVYATGPLEIHRCDKPTGQKASAAWLFPELGEIDASASRDERLKQLAALMTARNNGRFSRTIVNRLWAQLMGRGIVHPLDAMHTRPWNEDLLDYLANYLVEQDYDLKAVLRLIATSSAYAARGDFHTADRSGESEYVFAGPRAKRMTAEQFVDAVWQLTNAAPQKFDAPVIRGKLEGTDSLPIELQGQWFWGESAEGGKASPGGEQLVFRKQIELPAAVVSGAAAVTADNAFEMHIGRRQVASSNEWSQVQSVPLAGLLKQGKNEIIIVARNFLDTPNLAACFFEAQLTLADGSTLTIAADQSWEVSKVAPVGGREGRLGQTKGPWTPVTLLGHPSPYASAETQAKNILALGLSGVAAMVRASLLKSDFLMRSLGRPNRDQIVTSRPSELTTLEAIDLSNGETLAQALKQGARHWSARHLAASKETTPAALVDRIFRMALSRRPSEIEMQTLVSTIGPELDERAIEDVLWAICMMPEFVVVR